ncbi:MAG: hypothetical protein C0602_13195 [Denitrovibrio sp.]|nr:MAG: hypothetical protein C0602_13195 [Denitrovibrio sp.]
MYLSNLSAHTIDLRMSYEQPRTQKTMDSQVSEKSDVSGQEKPKETEKSSSFADVLSIASKDITPITNMKAYIQDSVNKVLEKIADHASKSLSGQAGEYSVSVTSISITIEMEEGESLKDVKNELDNLLSEDGYWGVEKTSQRMFDFAVALSGNNPDELEKARDAVTKGFKQAEAMFGGNLPDISYDTYDATMTKFDNYIEQINGSLQSTFA